MDINAQNCGFVYNSGSPIEAVALRDVTFAVRSGECLGILGRTGSGKTTLVKILSGSLRPTSGDVSVEGHNVKDYGPELKKRVGLVFQRPERQLFEDTVFKDISFVLRRFEKLEPHVIAERVARVCARLGLDAGALRDRNPWRLSTGEQRLVAIAGVLIKNPRILILDEPAVGLDPSGQLRLLDALRGLKATGVTLVCVSHDMEPFLDVVDKLLVVDSGKSIAFGAVSRIAEMSDHDEAPEKITPPLALLLHKLVKAGFQAPPRPYDVKTVAQALKNQPGVLKRCAKL